MSAQGIALYEAIGKRVSYGKLNAFTRNTAIWSRVTGVSGQ